MVRIFHKCGYPGESELDESAYRLRIPFTKRRRRLAARAKTRSADG
jgi:hypothetical protein